MPQLNPYNRSTRANKPMPDRLLPMLNGTREAEENRGPKSPGRVRQGNRNGTANSNASAQQNQSDDTDEAHTLDSDNDLPSDDTGNDTSNNSPDAASDDASSSSTQDSPMPSPGTDEDCADEALPVHNTPRDDDNDAYPAGGSIPVEAPTESVPNLRTSPTYVTLRVKVDLDLPHLDKKYAYPKLSLLLSAVFRLAASWHRLSRCRRLSSTHTNSSYLNSFPHVWATNSQQQQPMDNGIDESVGEDTTEDSDGDRDSIRSSSLVPTDEDVDCDHERDSEDLSSTLRTEDAETASDATSPPGYWIDFYTDSNSDR